MAKFMRLKVLTTIIQGGLIPLFYHPDEEVMFNCIRACLDGGVRCFEFTNRGDQAFEVFNKIINRFKGDDRLMLGAGTVMDSPTAALYLQAGANFIVGPTLNPEIARLCNRRKVAYIPGCGTTSEISRAEELGAEICKVFPGGTLGGPGFIKNILGPMPWSRLVPTGGVKATEENVSAWIKAGAVCVGIGSDLFPKEIIQNNQYSKVTESVRNVLQWIDAARDHKDPLD